MTRCYSFTLELSSVFDRNRQHKIDQSFAVMRRAAIGVDGLISMLAREPEPIDRQRVQIGLRPCRRQARARSQPKYRKQPHAK